MNESHRSSVHQALGGGQVADVLLWRRRVGSVFILVASTSLWLLFERAGYNILSFVSNVLLLLVVILFLWAKCASLLNRPLPPLPNLEISQEYVLVLADTIQPIVNCVLSVAREIAVDGNLKLFLKVAFGLWVISFIGSFFNFITLVYLGILVSLSLPALYEKYQDPVDDKLTVAHKMIETQCRSFDDKILRRIKMPFQKEKKI
ncbi:reticulon-like protein B11 [Impatiens glandulifera]|uniref:reticulon-like protein B11 n=1 Tax=Impatiens glandulifera TaxID=253017 RepID=UPI001FB057F2|nr:reticulon-like protein B11 [Impatiens glandulifera]